MYEHKDNADDARYYNKLMTSWHAIIVASLDIKEQKHEQQTLL